MPLTESFDRVPLCPSSVGAQGPELPQFALEAHPPLEAGSQPGQVCKAIWTCRVFEAYSRRAGTALSLACPKPAPYRGLSVCKTRNRTCRSRVL